MMIRLRLVRRDMMRFDTSTMRLSNLLVTAAAGTVSRHF
jgi:hypothetical protein